VNPFGSKVRDFAKAVLAAREKAKGPDFFRRRGDCKLNELRVLRRWNSHTPSLLDVWGGGYFLRWLEKGTIIDPGVSFLRLFSLYTPYGLQDVDMIVTTHDHFDHCGDFGALVSLLRAYNGLKEDPPRKKHPWDIVVSCGVADQFRAILRHPENARVLRWRRALPSKGIVVMPAPGRSVDRNPRTLSTKYHYSLRALKTFHKELLGENTGFGVHITLAGTGKHIVISSDTAIARGFQRTNGRDLVDGYRGANLLILHVGTMEDPGKSRLKQHLGLTGVVEVLSRLADDETLKLVVLSEWGYEFGRLGLRGRSRFTELVVEELERRKPGRFFAAVEGTPPGESRIPILPADLSLRVSLPDFGVWPDGAKDPEPAVKIRANERADGIRYLAVGT
jgi:ribonuclease BN (tRNA processing enzyme)